jgi:hypothetical protein
LPKPNWDKKTISTYITQQQKEEWEKAAFSECKRIADFVRDRVESTLNKDLNGKICLWLEIPQELYDKAQTEFKDNKINPLENLIQYNIKRILTLDTGNELMWEKSASSPDIETFKAKISELDRQIELLKFENEALRNRTGLFDSNAILNVLDKTEFMEIKHIAELLNRNNDENEIHELYDEVVETMFQVGMIEYLPGKGYRLNPDVEPVERVPEGKKLKIKVEK